MRMAKPMRELFARYLRTALVLSLLLWLVPAAGFALTNDTATARSNESGTTNVLGGVPTRITWEAVVDKGESISEVTLAFPQGSAFTEATNVRVTVLEGTDRVDPDHDISLDATEASAHVMFSDPLEEGQRLRVEVYEVALPNVEGAVSLSGSYVRDDGEEVALPDSPEINVTSASPVQQLVDWLSDQPAVQTWNSVPVLRLFLNPQLIVSST